MPACFCDKNEESRKSLHYFIGMYEDAFKTLMKVESRDVKVIFERDIKYDPLPFGPDDE